MAFRQPQQRPQAPRQSSYQHNDPAPQPGPSQQKKRTLEESRDWVLFAPPSQTDTSHTARTADLSRASYFGSLETGVRSELLESDDHILRQVTAANDDDATELDSLDDGLQAFQEPPSPHFDQSGTVLPAHDGLGSFPASFNNSGQDAMQEQIWQHERYNPQRKYIHRRLSSVQKRLDALDNNADSPEMDPQEERRLRVERWRTEQSKAVLEEIERETRRRYRRLNRMRTSSVEAGLTRMTTASHVAPSVTTAQESTSTESTDSEAKPVSEGFWQRITRTVIRDLMGLDENTLSVIFGEDLPAELSATPARDSAISEAAASEVGHDATDRTWEERLLARIGRELGILVYQLSELESAFNIYNSRSAPSTSNQPRIPRTTQPSPRPRSVDIEHGLPDIFRPTLNRPSPVSGPDASLWGIEEEPLNEDQQAETSHWERHPSIMMIFNYLRNRLQQQPSTANQGPLPAEWATTSASALGTSPESQRRADLIRRHHPLVSRAAAADRHRRESLSALRRHRTDLLASALHRRQGSSSCASQSTKRSRRSSGTGQSRKYWDLGGSLNESSAVSSGQGAAAGAWGEV
ncbi:hypothetical protein K461DRAFT_278850 [Myriangium duriaei CBS 260.36]|uniref:Uncharacterized protein n=1 Tax=Myriangium duriaei CBS 260.36 TaxID=1168546 RepID=A0A9P4IZU6_9PEZI|nr:hypothetical protein K461DRAFT_278850 [Myriangium duriaei CBS 260.36]